VVWNGSAEQTKSFWNSLVGIRDFDDDDDDGIPQICLVHRLISLYTLIHALDIYSFSLLENAKDLEYKHLPKGIWRKAWPSKRRG